MDREIMHGSVTNETGHNYVHLMSFLFFFIYVIGVIGTRLKR